MYNNPINTRIAQLRRYRQSRIYSQIADKSAAGGTEAANIEIDREVLSWSVLEYKMHFANN